MHSQRAAFGWSRRGDARAGAAAIKKQTASFLPRLAIAGISLQMSTDLIPERTWIGRAIARGMGKQRQMIAIIRGVPKTA